MSAPLSELTHKISLARAIAMTQRYRQQKHNVIKKEFAHILPLSETFNRAAFDRLLSQAGCAGVRIYYSMDEELQLHTIIVGVNANNEDLLPVAAMSAPKETAAQTTTAGSDGEILEEAQVCPPSCSPASPLNT